MKFQEVLKSGRKTILEQWFEATIRTYPADTARMLARTANAFDNPVGSTTRKSLEKVIDSLAGPIDPETLENDLDPVIRIRAVQGFSASDAVGFVFFLKDIVQKMLGQAYDPEFDRNVDQVGLAAFNRYMKCREEIFLLKATEAKRRIHGAFKRAGLVTELSEDDLLGSNKS